MPFTVGQYLTANDLKSQEDAHTLGYGVVNGLKVVPTDPASMVVQVETGKAYVADTLVEKGAVTDLTVGAADPTNPRKDIVVSDSAGTLSIVAGTPEAALPSGKVGVYTLEPEPPNIPADSIILAEIWVPAGATEITGSEIYDKRVFTVDRLGKARLEWAANKILKGAGPDADPTEIDLPVGGDMARAVYDPDLDGKIALAQLVDAVCSETEADGKITTHGTGAKHRWTDEKLRKGAGAGADPDEIDVPVSVGAEATVAMFQANPATGTSADPENINDNNTETDSSFTGVNQYAEIDFQTVVVIKRWRWRQGQIENRTDYRFKIQYYNLATHAWADWKTDIPGLNAEAWTALATEAEVLTSKIRWVCTTKGAAANILVAELEVIY